MKKTKKVTIALAVATCAGVLPLASVTASAGAKQTVFLDEQFTSSAFSGNKWLLNAASDSMKLEYDAETGHVEIKEHVEQYHMGLKNKIEGLEYVQFDYLLSGRADWTAINFSSTNQFPMSGGTFVNNTELFYNREIVFATNGFQDGTFGGCTNEVDVVNIHSGAVLKDEWYTFRMEYVSATELNLYGAPQGEDVKTSENGFNAKVVVRDADYNFDSFYMYLGACSGTIWGIDNFEIKSNTVNVSENFNDSDVDANIMHYAAVEGMSYDLLEPDNYLAVEEANAGDQLIYAKPLPEETSVVEDLEVLKVNFNISFAKAESDDAVAFAFGIPASKSAADGCYMLVMDSEGLSVAQYANGQLTTVMEKLPVDRFASGENTTVQIIGKKNGEIALQCMDLDGIVIAEAECVVEADNYYVGYLGFVAPQDNTGKIMIDELKIGTVSYKIPTTKSVSHNFSNDFFGNEGFEDFVKNEVGGKMAVKDGKLCWEGLSDYSYFGSAHQYDNFVLDYKLCSIFTTDDPSDTNGTAPERWIGLDFAKQNKGETQYGSNLMFGLTITPSEGKETTGVWIWDQTGQKAVELESQITVNKGIPSDWFRAIQYNGMDKSEADIREGDAVCIRWVAENGIVRMYAKKASQMEYTLFYEIKDIDTMGYFALCNTGFSWWKIDDFSMSNISDLYYNADSFSPEKVIVTEEKTWYDRGNTDMNGLNETELNKGQVAETQEGCKGEIGVACAMLPMLLAGGVILGKKSKNSRGK